MKGNLLLLFLFSGTLYFSQKPIFTKAKVTAVNVYRSSAELQNSVNVSLPAGTSEVVVTNISDEIVEKSVQINTNNKNISILSAQYRDDYNSTYFETHNPNGKRIKDSIAILENLSTKIGIERQTNEKTLELLDKNQALLVGSNTSTVAQLMQLTEYYKTKRNEISIAQLDINKKYTETTSKLEKLKNRLKANTEAEETISDGVLVLKIANNVAGNAKMDLGYLVENVSWEPFYEVKGNKLTEPLDVTFKAKLRQDTGLDWKGVKLSLINARSSRNNNAPVLNPWFLNSYKNEDRPSYSSSSRKDTVRTKEIEEVVVIGYSSDFKINENQLNISFDVDIPYDVLSNNEDHFINLKQIKIPADYKYYTVPKYNATAYLIADIKDFNKYDLIAGSANVIFENMYVGETRINPNQTDDKMSITLGDDKKISIRKEVVNDKASEKFFSSYQEKTFTYDLIVRNNKKEVINIDIKDQIPLSKDESVKIELLQSDNADVDKEKGFLTWNVKISPSETRKFRVSYKVRYPKDFSISNLK
ncbi:hypothetical protein C1637_10425 [Chryseobacterium lactis]|uniref:Mucoidy inhibitor MuiA family protein n=1 Tax=Chryseobacterium lactis TaxID=1241981 RepID=A0A3G6RLQ9_CHRLC|nr:DUF4139 domain-containing protein [Chryseobacterium lactis]AZA82080.1 mucoidy inhibitor MuiA family protein [Chryseobacterium lactis]AZB02460.1 mucoidy inhibitor MuiA family protein [Chryseobacterium lactis]PNW14244.1 hypothetical protein C1637_10425 [Chryseobacterium lactis]